MANKLEWTRKFGKCVSWIKADRALLRLQNIARGGQYLRAVIYHDTPANFAHSLEKQFSFYKKNFSPVSKKDLDLFFQTGRWHKSKPGLMITFDDGFKSNFDVAYPLLERYGFTGWFFIPTGFVDTLPAMSWKEIGELDRTHEIGCHTQSHLRMSEGLSPDILKKEIVESKKTLEEKLNHKMDLFCWVGGELPTYTRQAHAMIQKAGYRYSFMTNSSPIRSKTPPLFLNRTYVEPFWSVEEVVFMISGIIDLLYFQKRKKITNRLK